MCRHRHKILWNKCFSSPRFGSDITDYFSCCSRIFLNIFSVAAVILLTPEAFESKANIWFPSNLNWKGGAGGAGRRRKEESCIFYIFRMFCISCSPQGLVKWWQLRGEWALKPTPLNTEQSQEHKIQAPAVLTSQIKVWQLQYICENACVTVCQAGCCLLAGIWRLKQLQYV